MEPVIYEKEKENIGEVLTVTREDRRTLANVPDPEGIRSQLDRRGIMNSVFVILLILKCMLVVSLRVKIKLES